MPTFVHVTSEDIAKKAKRGGIRPLRRVLKMSPTTMPYNARFPDTRPFQSLVRTRLWSIPLAALILNSCAHSGSVGSRTPATSLVFPGASGAQQARQDIATGRLQLMEAGTRSVYAPSVPAGDPRFSK